VWPDTLNLSRCYFDAVALLEQAEQCLRDETPEDCSREEARAETLARIRAVVGGGV
jgi:hypothetical protein